MKENSIERDIHLLESYAGMTHKMNDNQGRPKLDQAIEHILSDYKRVLKENEELKFEERRRIIGKYGDAEIHDVINKILSNDYIPVQKVKDKIEELKQERDETYTKFLGGNRTDENLSTRGKMIEGGIKVLQELLEESEE